jgi:hypothetical protein
MIPGSNHVVACSRCGALAQYRTVATQSGHASRVWTDGVVMGPLMNPVRVLFVCRNCDHVQWLHDARTVRIYESWAIPARTAREEVWYSAPTLLEPEEHHYYAALQSKVARVAVGESLLRMFAWRRHNDAFRCCDVAASVRSVHLRELPPATGACLDNMERLAEMLSEQGDFERILCAEVLRELGRFEFALDVLNDTRTQCHPPLAAVVRALCQQEETRLGEVVRR